MRALSPSLYASLPWALAVALASPVALAQTKTTLPLSRVRLYETGVGYFERAGAVGGGEVELPIPTGHLDDALKSLVVLSDGGAGQVHGVTFPSTVSRAMGRALAGIEGDDGSTRRVGYSQLLASLRGHGVEVRKQGRAVKGRLVDVEEPPAEGREVCATVDGESRCHRDHEPILVVLAEDGSLQRFRRDEIDRLTPTEDAWAKRFHSALDALGSRGGGEREQLTVQTSAGAKVRLGYVAEAPVWRSTYRLVLADGGSSALQGWALIHNDTDERWKDVKIELVNGRPDSFLFPLAAPRYGRRPLVTPDEELSTVPQLLDETVDDMWSQGESFGGGGLGLSGVGMGGGGRGEGIGLGNVGTVGHGGSGGSGLLAAGNLAEILEAEGVEAGATFRYALPKPVSLPAHGSALMPFVQASLSVKRLALFESPGQVARTALRFDNGTTQTFPAGVVSIFADGGFAGESALSRTKPGESRVLTFGQDLDVELARVGDHQREETKLVERTAGGLRIHFYRHHQVTLALANKSASGRRFAMPLTFAANADVQGADELILDEERGRVLAFFDVPAQSKPRRELVVREGLFRDVASPSRADLEKLADEDGLPDPQRAHLAEAARRLQAAVDKRAKRAGVERDIRRLRESLATLQSTVRSLGSDHDEAEPLVKRMLRVENQLRKARSRLTRLSDGAEADEHAAEVALDALKR